MKLGHDITDPEVLKKIRTFRPGVAVQVKSEFMNAGKTGAIVSVFAWNNDIAASVNWRDGGRETVSIHALELGE